MRLEFDILVVRATGEIQADTRAVERFQKRHRAFDCEIADLQFAPVELRQARIHEFLQFDVVNGLVTGRVEDLRLGHEIEFAHQFHQALHLHDGLDARGGFNEMENTGFRAVKQCLVRSGVMLAEDRPHHHRLHDLLPPLAQRGDRAVVVEYRVPDVQGLRRFRDDLDLATIEKLCPVRGLRQFRTEDKIRVRRDAEDFLWARRPGLKEFLRGHRRRHVGDECRRIEVGACGNDARKRGDECVACAHRIGFAHHQDAKDLEKRAAVAYEATAVTAGDHQRGSPPCLQLPNRFFQRIERDDFAGPDRMTACDHHLPVVQLVNCGSIGFVIPARINDKTDLPVLPDDAAEALPERRRIMDAADNLVIDQDHRHLGDDFRQTGKKLFLRLRRKPVEIAVIDPAQLRALHIRFHIGVGGPIFGLNNQPARINTGPRQLPAHLPAKRIITKDADGKNPAHAERKQVCHHIAGPAGRISLIAHRLGRQSRLNGGLGGGPVNRPVDIHAEIAEHGDGGMGKSLESGGDLAGREWIEGLKRTHD